MTNELCTIQIFDAMASKDWPFLFNVRYETYEEFLKRRYNTGNIGIGDKVKEEISDYRKDAGFYKRYVYPQQNRITIERVDQYLSGCQCLTKLYFAKMSSMAISGKKLAYFLDVQLGMVLICAESNTDGLVEDIHVYVYKSLEEYSTMLRTTWNELDADPLFKFKKMYPRQDLIKLLIFM